MNKKGNWKLVLNLASLLRVYLIRGGVGAVGCYAKHSLRWSGSKNKQGFLSLTPFTVRVMSLGPVGGGHFGLHNRCEALRCRLPMSPDWDLNLGAWAVVGTCVISSGSTRGLALTAVVRRGPRASFHLIKQEGVAEVSLQRSANVSAAMDTVSRDD